MHPLGEYEPPDPWYIGLRYVVAFLILALGLTLLMTNSAPAQSIPCAPAAEIEKALMDKYGESPAWVGISDGGPIVLTMSETGGWTLYLRRGDQACMLSSGEGGQLVDLPKPGEPS